VRDTSGNALAATYQWSFTTQAGLAFSLALRLVID
jgi:hypothetical protein